jgi:ribosomal peptide maturation radical SAM protein 1
MDLDYISTLLPDLANTGWDLRLHYEVKSNLRRDHVKALGAAGVVHVQPGIESLSSRVLKIMDKGVDAVTNVRLLRDCEELYVTTPWNYLYGFPGEEAEDYRPVVEQFPNLHHLQPPRIATRIALERFSPYHQRPELGFAFRRPAEFYKHVYDLPERELMDIVFIFDCEPSGISGDAERSLRDAVTVWQDAYFTSTLTYEDHGDEIVISDRRAQRPARDFVLSEPWHVSGYRVLSEGHGPASLSKALGRLGVAFPGEAAIEEWLEELRQDGLVFAESGRFVTLATAGAAARVPIEHWR